MNQNGFNYYILNIYMKFQKSYRNAIAYSSNLRKEENLNKTVLYLLLSFYGYVTMQWLEH